jgi:carbonic anhydrase/acetyltransferase-like protein (isoleucine patch superfamily)
MRIEEVVYVGPRVIVLPDVTIGRGAVVAAGSVSQSLPPLGMGQGRPAQKVAKCGVLLVGNTYEQFVRHLGFIDSQCQRVTGLLGRSCLGPAATRG